MPDLRTHYTGFVEGADYALDALGLAPDDGLETAVILSLFSDARADADDVALNPGADPRGWWGDLLPLARDYRLGSKLWLLEREKQLPVVLERARAYAEDALTWLVTSGAASRVDVTASNPRDGILALAITIEAPALGTRAYQYLWEYQGAL